MSTSTINMFTATLTSVAWPLVTVVLGVVFMFLFKKSIIELINRVGCAVADWVRKLSVQKTSDGYTLTSSQDDVEVEEKNEKEEPVKEILPVGEDDVPQIETKSEKVPETIDDWRSEMINAFFETDRKRMDEAYKEIQKLAENAILRKEEDIFYLRLAHRMGDVAAVSKLKMYLIDSDVQHSANLALGFCYASSDDFSNAGSFYKAALEKSTTDEERSTSVTLYADVLFRNSQKKEAIDVLIDILSSIMIEDCKVRIYTRLAEFFEKENDYENRAFVLEKAIEIRPNDADILFKAGFSYSKSNYNDLSLLHYKNASSINPKDDAVQNNLGVEYDTLDMPIKSISSYQQSERCGNTLASANLAYRLLRAGFKENALTILDSAKVKEDVHPNVNRALSEVEQLVEKEDEKEKSQIKEAIEFRKFFLAYAGARFSKGSTLNALCGLWVSEKGIQYSFECKNGKVIATWTTKINLVSDFEHEHKLEGNIFNNSAIVDFYRKEYDSDFKKKEFQKKGRGLLCCSHDGNVVTLLEFGAYKSRTIHKLTKKE